MYFMILIALLTAWPPLPAGAPIQETDRYVTERVVIGGPTTGRPYSPAIRTTVYRMVGDGSRVPVSTTLQVSGQIAINPDTRAEVRESITAETQQVLDNIKHWVESAGFSMTDVVKCTVYLADIGDYDAMNAVYVTYFPVDPPARECVAVKEIVRGFRVEISCTAQR